jgi:hypothetical protein
MVAKKTIIVIVGILSVAIFFGVYVGFQKLQGSDKKVIINFSQEAVIGQHLENKVAEDAVSDSIKNDEHVSGENNENTLQVEPKKEKVDIAKSVVDNDQDVAKNTKLSVTNRLVSWGFQKASARKIDTIIIHSSYDALGSDPYSVSGVIAEYKEYEVAPHYLIDRKGNVSRLVQDANIAYHAGESKMPDGRTGVNNFSIGVEMLTTKKDKLTQDQYDALKLLIVDFKAKYKITAVLGHNQIAPGRKDDPWNFEWGKLK